MNKNQTVTGKVTRLFPKETGHGNNGPWTKKSFEITTFDKKPVPICFETWNDSALAADNIQLDQELSVSYNLKSEYYTDKKGIERASHKVNAWKWELINEAPVKTGLGLDKPEGYDAIDPIDELPF